MRLSWNTLGYVIKTGCISGAIGFVLGLLLTRFPDSFAMLLAGGIAGSFFCLAGIFCAICALLYFTGLLKITCPLCGAASTLGGDEGYTYLQCPECGKVHAHGFFRSRYVIEDDGPSNPQPP